MVSHLLDVRDTQTTFFLAVRNLLDGVPFLLCFPVAFIYKRQANHLYRLALMNEIFGRGHSHRSSAHPKP